VGERESGVEARDRYPWISACIGGLWRLKGEADIVRTGREAAPTSKTTAKEGTMNRDLLAGSWRNLRGQVKARWGKLTDDDMAKIEGRFDQLVAAVQKRYGYAREEAEREIEAFLDEVQRKLEPQTE
jgi:uncharacterized protein YjbJ (UPF0337 family)